MSQQEQGLPTSTTYTDVAGSDGSVTRTTTTKYADGSEITTNQVIVSPSISNTTAAVDETTSSAPVKPLNGLYIASMVLYIIGTLLSFVTCILFALGLNESNWEAVAYIVWGVIAWILSFILHMIATPLMHCAASSYVRIRQSVGNQGCMIASWVLFSLSIVNIFVYLVIIFGHNYGEADEYAPWLYSLFILLDVPWIFMIIHAEAARKQDMTIVN